MDIVGCIPGIGEVADLVNAGISLARGDYYGAAASLIGCIPGIGDAAKVAMKGAKAATKAAKALNTIRKIVKVTQAFLTGASTLNTLLTSANALKQVFGLIAEGKFSITNREHVDLLIQIGQSGTVAANHAANKKKKKEEAAKNKSKDHDADSNHKSNKDHDGDNKPVKKQDDPNTTKNKQPEQNKTNENTCKYDPINVATGSLTIEQVDFVLEDILDTFEIKRTYESIYTNTQQPLGSKWLLNIGSYLIQETNEITILLTDFHIERFEKKEGSWENQRAGDGSYVLVETSQGYMLKTLSDQMRYYYNKDGNLEAIVDRNNNQTTFYYKGTVLESLELASGQTLSFEYDHGKLVQLKDCIGRSVKYAYEGDLLTHVTYPNGGVIQYTYTTGDYVETITDQNGHCYVKNSYDHKGRVVRQELANGEEYIILYDEANRTNTFLTMSNNQRISYVYDRHNLVTKTIYQDDTYEEVKYDEFENKIYEKDRLGNEIHRQFNEKCFILEETLPNGLITYYEYDEQDQLIHTYDNSGREGHFKYDGQGNLVEKHLRIDDNKVQIIKNTFDARGRLTTTTDPMGAVTEYQYALPFSNATTVKRPEGYDFAYEYDEVGRNMAIISDYGKVSFAYNHINYKTMVIDDEGNTTKYFYDKLGNLEKEVLPNQFDPVTGDGIGTTYKYNALDRLIRTTDPLGNIFALKKNTEGKVTKEINPNTYDIATDDGEGVCNIYDAEDRKIKICYPDGGIERIKYDANGNVIKTIQPEAYDEKLDDGPGFIYTYDCVNRLIQITGPDGVVQKRYVYDLQGNIIKEIDAKGYLMGDTDTNRIGICYQYNVMGWCLEKRVPVREEAGKIYYEVTQYKYDLAGRLIEERRCLDEQDEITANGRVQTINFVYDQEGRLIKVSDCTGAVMEYRYDSLNHRTYERRKINEETYQITNYKYSSSGRLIEVSESADKLGTGRRFVTTKYTYDATGNLIKIVTPKGYIIERTYDAANRLVKECHHDERSNLHNVVTLTYDASGNITALTDVNGVSNQFEYDLLNRQTKHISPLGAIDCTLYNKNGLVYKEIRPLAYEKDGEKGAGYTYQYDLNGRVTTVTNPLGVVSEANSYNAAGQLVAKRDALQNGVDFTYDLGGRQQQVTTTGGATQVYTYDARGNIIGIRDGNGQQTKYQLDRWGRITQIHKPDESVERYTYDYAGNIVTTTDSNEHTITYQFNTLNKLQKIIDQEGLEETFAYDAEGNLLEHINRNGTKVLYDYNMYGNLLRRREVTSNLSESYTYYPDGRLQTALAGGMRYHYRYDAEGRLIEKSASGRSLLQYSYDLNGNKMSQTDVTGKTTKYSYNILDELTEIIDNESKLASYTYHPDGSLATMNQANGLYTQYTYDSNKNLSGLEVILDGKNLVKNTYTYDNNGNRLTKAQLNETTHYQYAPMNRLTQVQYPTYSETLFYDKVGNRTKRMTESIEELYQYDAKNRLIELTSIQGSHSKTTHYAYDKQGNLLKDDQATYTYDSFNRTEKVSTFEGKVQINHYDAEGLRHEIEENGQLVQFIFNTNREVVVEKSDNDTLRLIRGYDITASESEQARTYYHYVSDELGSTTHIFEGHEIRNRYEYDAFGSLTTCEEQVANRFKYTGQQQDPITQQYYLRARFYNPVIARFTQEDPYRGAGLNLYAYCDNNPVVYIDPSGYLPCATKQELYKKYRAEGYSAADANNLANRDLIIQNQGIDAANKYAAAHPTGNPTESARIAAAQYNPDVIKNKLYQENLKKGMSPQDARARAEVDYEIKKVLDHYKAETTYQDAVNKQNNPNDTARHHGTIVHNNVDRDMKNWIPTQNLKYIAVNTEISYSNGNVYSAGKGSSRLDLLIQEKVMSSNSTVNSQNVIIGDIKTGKAHYGQKQKNKNEKNYAGQGNQNNYNFTHIEIKP